MLIFETNKLIPGANIEMRDLPKSFILSEFSLATIIYIFDFTAIFETFQTGLGVGDDTNKTPWARMNFQVVYGHWNW